MQSGLELTDSLESAPQGVAVDLPSAGRPDNDKMCEVFSREWMSSTLMVLPSRWLAHSSCHGLNVSFARSFCIPMIVVLYGILPWGSTHDCINRNLSMQDLYELRGSVGTQECSLVPMHLVGVSPPILFRSGVPS